MSISHPKKSFLPQYDGYALDFIKLNAAIFMIISHFNTICLQNSLPQMEFIGRGAFPLFCYVVAIAVLKVKNGSLPPVENEKKVKLYLVRLLIAALVSQPFYFYARGSDALNIIFTLALGVVFADLSFRAKLWQMYMLYAVALVSMLWRLPLEFGLAGVMLPSAVVLVLRGHRSACLFLILLLCFINTGGILDGLRAHISPVLWDLVALNGLFSIVLPWAVLSLARHIPQPRRSGSASVSLLPKYALYIFYPAHQIILKLLMVLK